MGILDGKVVAITGAGRGVAVLRPRQLRYLFYRHQGSLHCSARIARRDGYSGTLPGYHGVTSLPGRSHAIYWHDHARI